MSGPTSGYCIRPGYEVNPVRAYPPESAAAYWTERRIRTSGRHQFEVYRRARQRAAALGGRVVLDVGCGPATKLHRLFDHRHELLGVDTPAAVALCRQRWSRGRYFASDLESPDPGLVERLPEVDLLICADVIEHLDSPRGLLELIRSASTPRTVIFLSTPCRERLLGPDAVRPSNPEHVREWASWELRRYLEASGLVVEEQVFVRPFTFRPDDLTVSFLLDRLRRRLPLDTTQLVICRVA